MSCNQNKQTSTPDFLRLLSSFPWRPAYSSLSLCFSLYITYPYTHITRFKFRATIARSDPHNSLKNIENCTRLDSNYPPPYLAWHDVVGPERPHLEVLPELVRLPDLERHELVVELGPVHGAVHLEEPPHEVGDGGGDEDGGRAHPPAAPRGDVHGEAPDVVEVPMGDEEELLETALCGRFGFSVFKEIWFLKKI